MISPEEEDNIRRETSQEESISSGCSLCYGHCLNSGVEGRVLPDGTRRARPCSTGLSEILRLRRMRVNRPGLGQLPKSAQ